MAGSAWLLLVAFSHRNVHLCAHRAGAIVVGHAAAENPVLGGAFRKAETARFARAMATLVANSVPLVQSLAIAGATLNNRRIADRSKRFRWE